jgi:S1-C subfamily serine protease
MKTTRSLLVWLFVLPFSVFAQTPPAPAQQPKNIELNTILMESTFMIEGSNAQHIPIIGTAFIIGRPIPNQPNRGAYVLVTAAHVLDDMQGDVVVLHFRAQSADGNWSQLPLPIHIRAQGQPLWTKHHTADIAVMYVNLPSPIPLVSTDLLADDKTLTDLDIHPGDELECLGYPLGNQANDAGFPILRSGKIGSYPLLPTTTTKTFLFDFRVFQGNSGGPVYFVLSDRFYQGAVHIGQTNQGIIGLVSQERLVQQQILGPYDAEVRQVQLGLAVVVHASLIKEAINMLPLPSS